MEEKDFICINIFIIFASENNVGRYLPPFLWNFKLAFAIRSCTLERRKFQNKH